jgi:PAS domain S-box-containing protein
MNRKAMVVDNDFFFVEFLSELLEQRGYEIVKAYDSKEGVAKLEEVAVDILFADIIMPKIDGRQLIQFARKKFGDNRFPIVALSGTIIEQIEKVREFGADYFVAKGPIGKMAEQISGLLDRIEDPQESPPSDGDLIESDTLFPRQETVELMEVLSFQKAIVENLGVGIIVLDRDARIIMANPMALRMIRRPIEEVLNQQITFFVEGKDRPKVVGALKTILQRMELERTSFQASIGSRDFYGIASLLRTEGRIAGFILALEDLREWEKQA